MPTDQAQTTSHAGEQSTPEILPSERWIIVGLAIFQGLGLFAASFGRDLGLWPFTTIAGRFVCYAVVLAVPTTMALCLTDRRDRRLWKYAGIMTLIYGGLAAYGGYQLSGYSGLNVESVTLPFILSMAVFLVVATPFAQCWLAQGRFRFSYAELFKHSWNDTLTLAIAALFTGIFWLLLFLWQGMFALIKVDFFAAVFGSNWFYYPVTGLFFGLGLVIGRTQYGAVGILRNIVLSILKGLLPVLSFVGIHFICALPVTGLEPLWKTRSAASLLMVFLLALVSLVNGVYQDGRNARPYPAPIRRLVEAAVLLAPIYAGLAGYALWLRVMQYGWTTHRVWAAIICVTLALYTLAYAYSAIRQTAVWLGNVSRFNVAIALFIMAVLLLINLPGINPRAIAVASQTQRLVDGTDSPGTFDYAFLRFHSGRDGADALRALKKHKTVAGNKEIVQAIDDALARKREYSFGPDPNVQTAKQMRRKLITIPETLALDPDFLRMFLGKKANYSLLRCLGTVPCIIISLDLNRDGREEYLIFRRNSFIGIDVYGRSEEGKWKWVATGQAEGSWRKTRSRAKGSLEALRKGNYRVVLSRWDALRIGDIEYHFNTH